MNQIRRLDLTWQNEEVKEFETLKEKSDELGESLPKYVKDILRENIKKKN